ncbi:hypothetical protein [Limimaricola pyoseonensis]|uniref:Uncharacterized protein n=1 Tax=Limimaricola pyoseonensis TaxID=521013 RepID=A0A1G7GPF6_9RHOB|nr:hypothetical protein [Limimaricola pyoseonensis]SDE90017.1 hypothetical protein SAMN04488567_2869 [Limimaricola pyoseonensis]
MTWNALTQAHLDAGKNIDQRWLIWVVAENKSTGAAAPMGLWTGGMSRTLTVEGEARLYHGAQGGIEIPSWRHSPGTAALEEQIVFAVTPEAETLVRNYHVRYRPVQVHLAAFDPANGDLLDIRREFEGVVTAAPQVSPPINGVATLTLSVMSSAFAGMITTNAMKSDQSQQQRAPGDRFRRYGDAGTHASDPWGTSK